MMATLSQAVRPVHVTRSVSSDSPPDNRGTTGQTPIRGSCSCPWCQYSYPGWFQATNMTLLSGQLGREAQARAVDWRFHRAGETGVSRPQEQK